MHSGEKRSLVAVLARAATGRAGTNRQERRSVFRFNDAKQPLETAVPYTLGMWQQTPPIEITLEKGPNTIHFGLKEGSRGVSIKDFTLTAVK